MIFKSICVLGLGYIGLPTASTFATHGLHVVGVDVNLQVVTTLHNEDIHIHEPGLRTLVQAAVRSGNLIIQETPAPADAFIIAVPTPFYDDKRADMSYVSAASDARIVVDTVNAWDVGQWAGAGFRLFHLGDGKRGEI